MVHEGPVWEAICIAQIAQVVAVAPHLMPQFWVDYWRTGHVIVQNRVVLRQPPGQVAYVLVHLHAHFISDDCKCTLHTATFNIGIK